MGVIFGYKTDTRVFNTYASWVAYMLDFPKNEMPELIYALETTFFHTFSCVDSKDELQKGIYHLHNGDNKVIEAEPPEYKNPTDSRIYPVIQAGEKLRCRACTRLLEFSKECISLIVNKIGDSDKHI